MSESGSIVVTGAAGFIGSHVVEALLSRGAQVIGVDNFDSFYAREVKRGNLDEIGEHANADRFSFVETDICDDQAMAELFDSQKVSSLVHLAARAGVRPSIEDPAGYAHVNVTGTAMLLNHAARVGLDRVVLASSSSVYGNSSRVPFGESDNVAEPISPYAATKRACELQGHAHHHLTGMPTACLRFFTVYGPRQRPDLAISKFLGLLRDGKPIPMFGDGSTSRDYTYIADIVQGVLAAVDRIDSHGYRIWNLGGNDPVTLRDMIATIERVTDMSATIQGGPMQPGDVNRTFADLTRSQAELDYDPAVGFDEGIARQWAWMQACAVS